MFAKYLYKLEKLGFSGNEAKVYLSLIKLSSSKAGTIAKYSNLDRSSAYNALKSLLQKGLVSYVTIGKIKWFQCSSSNNITSYFSNKIQLANEFLPELEKIRTQTKLKENVTLFKGVKGIRTVFENILRNADENLIFGSEGHFSRKMPNFAKQFVRKLEKKGIKVKSIIRTSREDKTDFKNKKIRTIHSTKESPVVTNIFSNKIAIIIWSDSPEAILIENKKAADAYSDYFNFMWKYAKK